jgi:hypothetical protein
MIKTTVISLLLLCLFAGCKYKYPGPVERSDVVIYGGTSAAVSAAAECASLGMKVTVISPEKHLGGMTSSGLGFTDTGNKEVIGGIARRFYQLIYDHYADDKAWRWQPRSDYGNVGQGNPAIDGDKRTMWIFEPHAAEEAFEKLVSDPKIKILRDEWLDRENGVIKKDGRIKAIKTLSGKYFVADVFVDASYEGDLMAASGVKYTVGREACSVFNEIWNGVQKGVYHHGHWFKDKISPYVIPGKPESGLLWGISAEAPGENCSGDNRIQAYCFRLCLTKNPKNRIPLPRPEGYDSSRYELLVRLSATRWNEFFAKYDPIPNLKTDVNNHGPMSYDNIGRNWDYPDASYARRKEIIDDHILYQQGILYFMATDKRLPAEVRKKMKEWGLSADEFKDNRNWPYNIYVREGRRMIGEYVMTENDIMGKRTINRPIAMGSYTMDSHNVQRYVTPDGFVQNEGDLGVEPPRPYQIDLGAILPKKSDCLNLIVPVCVSSSHIAFGSIRMEPVYMELGQAAGALASLSVRNNIPVYSVSYEDIKKQLVKEGQIIEYK